MGAQATPMQWQAQSPLPPSLLPRRLPKSPQNSAIRWYVTLVSDLPVSTRRVGTFLNLERKFQLLLKVPSAWSTASEGQACFQQVLGTILTIP